MCAITGIVGHVSKGGVRETHDLLSALFVESQTRGVHASGFSAVTSPLDAPHRRRLITSKAPQAAETFVQTDAAWRALRRIRCCTVIAHARFSTFSDPAHNPNNHPFIGRARGTAFSMIHNGVISQHESVARRLGVTLATETDSEIIEKMISMTGNIPLGIRRCLSELRGSMAVAVLEHASGNVWLARDHQRPLWVARLKDHRRVVFASTPQIIQKAVENSLGAFNDWVIELQPLAPGYVYLLQDGRLNSVFSSAARIEEVAESG